MRVLALLLARLLAIGDAATYVSTSAYVHIYGAPENTMVPVVIGFRTASLASYSTASTSAVTFAIASGLDFSSAQIEDIRDVVNLPSVLTVTTAASSVTLNLERSLASNTDYEFTILAKTQAAGGTMGATTVTWSGYAATGALLDQEQSTENQGRGAWPRQKDHLVGATIRTATNSFTGTGLTAAWEMSDTITAYTLTLKMSQPVSGIVSVVPFPPSAWHFQGLTTLADGAECPSGDVSGVAGQAFGVKLPSTAAYCFVRMRGQHLNSFDIWFMSQDLSDETNVLLYVPAPTAGTLGSWYISYREFGNMPGYLTSELTVAAATAQQFLQPTPSASLSSSSYYPGEAAVLQVDFKIGVSLFSMTNSRVDILVDSSVFTVAASGCQWGSATWVPRNSFLLTSVAQNACTVTWLPASTTGTGTVQVQTSGEVTGTGVNFHTQSVVGVQDTANAGGSSWQYLVVGSTRYIIKARTATTATGQTVEVLATAIGNLRGTNTKFATGTFDEALTVGDYVIAGGRTFVVTTVRDDTTADVQEGGGTPATALSSSAFSVLWISKLRVLDFFESTPVTAAAAGSAFSLEQFTSGHAYSSLTYSLQISGTNHVNASAARFSLRTYSGKDTNGDGNLDYWAGAFTGDAYRVEAAPSLGLAVLYPTTVAAGATARVLLAFRTGSSSRFGGEVDENLAVGMLLRIRIVAPTAIRLFMASSSNFASTTTEAEGLDCSNWLLEVWSDAEGGFPQPAACWWSLAEPTVYLRLQAGSSFRALSRYELVFHAALEEAANSISSLMQIHIFDGAGTVIINSGEAGIMGTSTIVPESINGAAIQPVVTSVEVVDGDPLGQDPLGSTLKVRVRGSSLTSSMLQPRQRLRLFLFPLTLWNGTTCVAERSDIYENWLAPTTCAMERLASVHEQDRNANTVVMVLNPNSEMINATSNVVFTISRVQLPPAGFFATGVGVEAYYNPSGTTEHAAFYLASTTAPLGAGSLMSLQVDGGVASILSRTSDVVQAQNEVAIQYTPSATCLSTADVPCRIDVVAPSGFTMSSASSTEASGVSNTRALLPLNATNCTVANGTCTLEMLAGTTIWARTAYVLQVTVTNPTSPISQESSQLNWTLQLSGEARFGGGNRTYASVSQVDTSSYFGVRGILQNAAIQPGPLICGAIADFRVQFTALQKVPAGGMVKILAPSGFSLEGVKSSSVCEALPQVNFPEVTACSASSNAANLTIGVAIEIGTFVTFDVKGRWPTEATNADQWYFRVATSTATEELDVAERAVWSPQTSGGQPLFSGVLGCYPSGIDVLDVTLDNMLPYALASQAATALVRFRWHGAGLAIERSPVELRLYAPPSYLWEVLADGTGLDRAPSALVSAGASSSPVLWLPGQTAGVSRGDANVLYLLTTEYLQRGTIYGFSAKVRVPSSTPGTSENPSGGNFWYMALGGGMSGTAARWAAARVAVQAGSIDVRAISAFAVESTVNVPDANATVTASFKTVTALPAGGVLELTLPEGVRLGLGGDGTCTTDAAHAASVKPTAKMLPSDAAISCTTASATSGPELRPVLRWSMPSGMEAGSYALAVPLLMPSMAPTDPFDVRTFSDAARTVAADFAATTPMPTLAVAMPQAEIVIAYLDETLLAEPRVDLFDQRPSMLTWVVFGFELNDTVSSDVSIQVRAPAGFDFPGTCDVHIGDGVSYSPLGDTQSVQPTAAEAPNYVLFPQNVNATCAGVGRDAQIAVSPATGGPTEIPAQNGSLYLFRVSVNNPASTPVYNDWQLSVADQEYGGITGYDIWEFDNTTVEPSNMAAGQNNTVTIRFQNRQSILGLRLGRDHGLVIVQMPEGFELASTGGVRPSCLDFEGLYNISNDTKVMLSPVLCEGLASNGRLIYLRIQLDGSLTPGFYEFSCRVRNPFFQLDPYKWTFESYERDTALATERLESAVVAGFAVNSKFQTFGVLPEPPGQQNSSANVTMVFRVKLLSEFESGDVLVARGPSEYVFEEQGSNACPDFSSDLLPAPVCNGSEVKFSFEGVTDIDLPNLRLFGSENATMLTFQFRTMVPVIKPKINRVQLAHCRNASRFIGGDASPSGPCPTGQRPLASSSYDLWAVHPQLQNLTVDLLPPKVRAQGKSTLFTVSFRAVSPGGVKLRVNSTGMDFTSCTAEYLGVEVTCTGQQDSALITLNTGQLISNGGAVTSVIMRRAVNPVDLGYTEWSVTTYDAQDTKVDETVSLKGYLVTGYMGVEAVVDCQVDTVVNLAGSGCTAADPWYLHTRNAVTLRFSALEVQPRVPARLGYWLLVQPPQGYIFTRTGSMFQIMEDFPEANGSFVLYSGDNSSRFNGTAGIAAAPLSDDLLGIYMPNGLPQSTYSLQVFMDNPGQDPPANLWKFRIYSQDQVEETDDDQFVALYTNDGDWAGFSLKGNFKDLGMNTMVNWLGTDFPSERNTVRLRMMLNSPLTGLNLRLKVVAPVGFRFDSVCLPLAANITPVPNASVSEPWVASCAARRTAQENAFLGISTELSKDVEYGVNLLITNADTFQVGSVWELFTFKNNDAINYVHYARIPAFNIQIMQVSVIPETNRYASSGTLHVSFRPMRDLVEYGEARLTAPQGFTVFCSLRPFFDKGNLPGAVTCSGSTSFAVIQLGGGERLERGVAYHFSIRVTNPSAADFARFHGTTTTPPTWALRLQTRLRELVHESTQVPGYPLTENAITRFAVMPSSLLAGVLAQIRVTFKLETALSRTKTNQLILEAPEGWSFPCKEEQSLNAFVNPATNVLPGTIARFDDLTKFLEAAPGRTTLFYTNNGTTEDGRAIVDCSQARQVALAVDYTEADSLQRFSFMLTVRNGMWNPVPNIWKLKSYSAGRLLEEGATAGYDLVNMTTTTTTSTPVSGAQARRKLTTEAAVVCLLAAQLTWALWQQGAAPAAR